MLQQNELDFVYLLREDYEIPICNAHDVRLRSLLTGHEWIIISPYDGSSCVIMHRHSARDPFHCQKGHYPTLTNALAYIQGHDAWYSQKWCSKVDAEM